MKHSITTNSSVVTAPRRKRLNASSGLAPEEIETLASVAKQLREVSVQLSGLIGDQVSDPTYTDGKDAAADRLLEWTADIFAISEDINFYLNPPTDK